MTCLVYVYSHMEQPYNYFNQFLSIIFDTCGNNHSKSLYAGITCSTILIQWANLLSWVSTTFIGWLPELDWYICIPNLSSSSFVLQAL